MSDRQPVTRSEAIDRILTEVERPAAGTEQVPLERAGGRMLASPVVASEDVPRVDRATMDGFAFAADSAEPRPIVAEVSPDENAPGIEPGEAVEIVTGAPLPPGADVVVMREEATVSGGAVTGPAIEPGANVYPAGTTAKAGEHLFSPGQRLAPRHVCLLRDVGIETVSVEGRLDVGLLPTGTEIVEGEQPDRDSEMLANLVRGWGHDPTIRGALRDDRDAIRSGIETAVLEHDVVISTGGTSVGSEDHVVRCLQEHELLFRGVALRPGRPTAVAMVDGTPAVALPGKPIAAYTAAALVVRPCFAGTSLPTVVRTLEAGFDVPDEEVEFAVPVVCRDGVALPYGHADSSFPLYGQKFAPGRVASSTRIALADGWLLTDTGRRAGEDVPVVPHEELR